MSVLRRRTRSYGRGEPEFLDLHEADLTGADLYGANLLGAVLSRAPRLDANRQRRLVETIEIYPSYGNHQRGKARDFSVANLSGANLRKANLSDANLSQAQLDNTIGDEDTQLPSHLKPPAHWSVKTDEQAE